MADNYLERKMEDLRMGRLTARPQRPHQSNGATGMSFVLPSLRVLIVSDSPNRFDIAQKFIGARCKVALMSKQSEQFGDSALRQYPLDGPVTNGNEITGYLSGLFKAWRDIDVLIADREYADTVITHWLGHRYRYPYTFDYRCRVILLGAPLPTATRTDTEIRQILSATVNRINPLHNLTGLTTLISSLTLPGNEALDGLQLEL